MVWRTNLAAIRFKRQEVGAGALATAGRLDDKEIQPVAAVWKVGSPPSRRLPGFIALMCRLLAVVLICAAGSRHRVPPCWKAGRPTTFRLW
jgi:hypothetical protein